MGLRRRLHTLLHHSLRTHGRASAVFLDMAAAFDEAAQPIIQQVADKIGREVGDITREQCIASPGPREETPDVPSDQGHESDVWLQLGLVEMPDSPRSEESTHSHLSSVPTVTNHSEGPGTPTTPFCDRITHTRGGRRSPSTSCSNTDPQRPKPPHRRLTPHTTGTGIGAPRPHAVNGVFPGALCFWVVVTLGTILGFVHCDALFVLTRQVPYVFGAGTRRLYVMLSGLAAAACSQCAPASRKRHVGCSCTYQAVS